MLSLWSLFASSKHRHYALLDDAGICRALRQSPQPPAGSGWVEVSECRLSWLQRPLPASARIPEVGKYSIGRQALAA
jgi:hypothetical protein